MKPKVTDIQIIPVKPKEGLVGFSSFIYNDSFYLGSIAIQTRKAGGFRLSYPTKKIGDKSLPIFHPLNHDIANLIEKAVIAKFEEIQNI